mmetsp:Transcript_85673/g.245876  ORF Transcript_85673/g.245876 Transcript_85673/m.245876 type:complete len:390 (+) Transcript_85673:473-1642(+)
MGKLLSIVAALKAGSGPIAIHLDCLQKLSFHHVVHSFPLLFLYGVQDFSCDLPTEFLKGDRISPAIFLLRNALHRASLYHLLGTFHNSCKLICQLQQSLLLKFGASHCTENRLPAQTACPRPQGHLHITSLIELDSHELLMHLGQQSGACLPRSTQRQLQPRRCCDVQEGSACISGAQLEALHVDRQQVAVPSLVRGISSLQFRMFALQVTQCLVHGCVLLVVRDSLQLNMQLICVALRKLDIRLHHGRPLDARNQFFDLHNGKSITISRLLNHPDIRAWLQLVGQLSFHSILSLDGQANQGPLVLHLELNIGFLFAVFARVWRKDVDGVAGLHPSVLVSPTRVELTDVLVHSRQNPSCRAACGCNHQGAPLPKDTVQSSARAGIFVAG